MRIYTLHEMAGLLRLGVWQCGEVEKLGHFGTAAACPPPACGCGLTGIAVDHHTMLERCEASSDAKSCELRISLYDPYAGEYKSYTLCSSITNREYLWARLEEVIKDIRQAYVWSHNLYKNNIFSIERRYGSDYKSMRSGRIGVPRRSNIFGR